MSTDLNDEVPVPHFEDTLWHELARIYEHEGVDPSSAPVVRPRHPGRRLMVAGAGSIAAAMVLLVGILVFGTDGSDPAGDAEAEADASSDPALTHRIVTATESALADMVEHEVTDEANIPGAPDVEMWRDQTTAAVRLLSYASDGSGRRSLDMGWLTPPSPEDGAPDPSEPVVEQSVDYCFEEHSVDEWSYEANATDISASLAKAVMDGLEDGSMRTDGTEVIDGRELIRVVEERTAYVTWYIDPVTYRPVRVVSEVDPEDEASMAYVTTIEYLPRTPENLAQLSPTEPPEGFVEVDELSRTDDWVPGCNG